MRHSHIDGGTEFDWGRTSIDYARFRDVYPPSFYAALQFFGIGLPGQRVLDLGTGTGVVALNLHRLGARVTGVDISAEQIAVARERSASLRPPIEWLVGDASHTGLPGGSFEAATAVSRQGRNH